MRKSILLTAIVSCIIICSAKAQYVNITDSLFRDFLLTNYPGCMNAQQQLDTTCSGILSAEYVNIPQLGSSVGCSGSDLTGLKYFKSLKSLSMFNNTCLATMPVINTLKEIHAPNTLLKLSWLPNGLKVFDLNTTDPIFVSDQPAFINDNGHFPDSLETLNCRYAFSSYVTGGLPPFPQGLKYLDLTSIQPLTIDSLPALPASLRHLDCTNLELLNFPALPASLTYLNWSSDFVRPGLPLPSLPPQLDTFELSRRLMKELPAMPATLKYFSCWGTDSTTTLPVMPDGLKTFKYYLGHSIHSIPPFPNSIVEIECAELFVDSLPALPTSLKRLVFNLDSFLTFLPALPPGLQYLECNYNKLVSLPPFPASLLYLKCAWNQIASLPPFNGGLITALCSGNRIREIQRIPNTIERLEIGGNNIFCLPFIPQTPYPTTIIADATIQCISTVNTRLSFYPSRPKLCTPTNNERRCATYPVVNGYLFIDANNNGIKDPGEPVKQGARVSIGPRGDNFTFSNRNGYYEIQADSIGAYTVTPEPWSVFFDYTPAIANLNFTRYETVTRQDFMVQANAVVDSVAINIACLNRLRPGFQVSYSIDYANTGSSTLVNPVITLYYDDTKLVFESSSVPVSQVGNTLVLNASNMPPLQQGAFVASFRVKPTTFINSTVVTTAEISANSKMATSTSTEIVTGSYDPNDKNATPQLSPLQVANGEYIDYTIRFQNTGNDTAFNVVISDTLNEDLQVNSLKMLAASHTCKTTVQGNVVFFEFLDILLPDSNVNEKASHGFVSFRIKPQTTVQPNTTIPNSAAIYFDYNAPVITNTAGTLIKNFIVVPLTLVSFSAVPQNDNTTTLYWNTANEINTKQFTIEQSTDGNKFNTIQNIAAKEKASNDYSANVPDASNSFVYYRLKIVDKDGMFTFSPIIKIDRRKNAAGIAVLTNPVKDFIVISTSDRALYNTQASIINTNGAVVKRFVIKQGSQTVEVKGLPTGVYYLRTMNGSSRFLKQ